MDRSESNNREGTAARPESVVLPRRSFTIEFVVGLFALGSLAAFAYLAVGFAALYLLGCAVALYVGNWG